MPKGLTGNNSLHSIEKPSPNATQTHRDFIADLRNERLALTPYTTYPRRYPTVLNRGIGIAGIAIGALESAAQVSFLNKDLGDERISVVSRKERV